jgi:hypothetical protein
VRIFIEEFQVGASRRGVEVVVILFNVLSVIPFPIRQAKGALLQDWILLIPEGKRKADVLVAITNSTDSILAPAVGSRTSMVVRKIVPRIPLLSLLVPRVAGPRARYQAVKLL